MDFMVKISAVVNECHEVNDIAVHGDREKSEEARGVGHDWRQQTEPWCTCSVVKMMKIR
jgi:hypothetical protein